MASAIATVVRSVVERLPTLFQRSGAVVPSGGGGTTSFDFGRGQSSAWWKPNWFQLGYGSPNGDAALRVSAVYACVAILAQEIARIELHLWKLDQRTGKRTQSHPNFERVLRRPNKYQTRSDFWLHMMQSLLLKGNAYCIAQRREGQIVALHPVPHNAIQPVIVRGTGEVWYHLGNWQLAEATERDLSWENMVPVEEVLHLRMFCPTHPLIGVSPLMGCGPAVQQSAAISGGSAAFFTNMSRPSGFLTAPKDIHANDEDAEKVRRRWRQATTESAMGGIVVIGNGYSWTPLAINAADAQLIEQYRMTVEDIARVFRVPLHMLGDLSKATFSNIDGLQRSFIVSGLGFYLKHIEDAVQDFFGLPMDEYAEFAVEEAMMRPEFKERMEAFARAVQGGVYSPNEIRAEEHLPAKKGGDMIFLQRQMTPVDQLVEQAKNGGGGVQPIAPTSAPANDGEDPGALKSLSRAGATRSLAAAIRKKTAERRRRRAA